MTREKLSASWSRHGLVLILLATLAFMGRSTLAEDPPKEKPKTPEAKVAAATPAPIAPKPGAAFEQVRIINEQIENQWKENKLTPSRRTTDLEFLRRVSLDVIGRIATPKEVDDFTKLPPATKRAMWIDRLLESEEFAKNWANIWTTWLLTRTGPGAYHEQTSLWLEEQFAKNNQGWDKIVTALLTATGENSDNGAVNYILSHLGETIPGKPDEGQFEMVPITSRTTRLFLGVQTQCTQCHDHPFNSQWKQKHFWGVNAFFRQVERKGTPAMARNAPPSKLTLLDNGSFNPDAKVFYEERKGVVRVTRATFLEKDKAGNDQKLNQGAGTRRQQLAAYITGSTNFQRAFVNRLWGHFFGRGFTNPGPVDDFGDHNPITHPLPDDFSGLEDLKIYGEKPTLLDYLANEFKKYQYNPRTLIKWICNSEAYNLSCVANKTNEKSDVEPFFSRMLLKSMSPEQLFESLMVATQMEGSDDKEAKKRLREQWLRTLTTNFGDDEGNEITFNGTVVQALIMMNGKDINDAISNKDKGSVAMAIKRRGATFESVLKDLYIAALNRPPTPKEVLALKEEVALVRAGKVKNKDVNALYQDVFWALVNSNEFYLNH